MIIIVSTLGFGVNLNSTITFNNIGSDNNIPVSTPDAVITNVVLFESGGNINSASITVKNTDVDSHAYKICVITKANSLISDTPGSSSDCTNTTSISSSSTGFSVISFTNPLNASDVDYSDISIQEIT